MPIRIAILVVLSAVLAGGALAARTASRKAPPPPRQEPYKCIDAGMVVYSDAPCVSATGGAPGGQAGASLSRGQVLQLMESFDRSAGRMDWSGLAGLIADDAVIQIQRSPSRGGRTSVGKAEFRRLLWQGPLAYLAVSGAVVLGFAALRGWLDALWPERAGVMLLRTVVHLGVGYGYLALVHLALARLRAAGTVEAVAPRPS